MHEWTERRASQQQIKASNLNLLLNLMYKNEPLSRARLAEMTSLSPTTVSSLIEELIGRGLVMEIGPANSAGLGRKAIQLQVNSSGAFVMSLEMVETGFHTGLFDLKRCCRGQVYTSLNDFDEVGVAMASSIGGVLEKCGVGKERLMGICVAAPGLIDIANKRVVYSTVIQIDAENAFCDELQRAYPAARVILGNESSFCAWAEAGEFLCQSIRDLVMVDINIGIGSGILLDGKIFTGSTGIAGELGHTTVDLNGPRCKCGSKGCLEVMASVPVLMHRASFIADTRPESMLHQMQSVKKAGGLTIELVADALAQKDPLCVEIVSDIARYLAFGLNNAINLLNPSAIILTGRITKLGEPFLTMIRQAMSDIAMKPGNGPVLQYSLLKDNAAMLGGAQYLLSNLLGDGALVNA
jgi:N-acetylglucosamine repressor